MSYDVYSECPHCGHELSSWNYTSNCSPMWCAAGADLAEFDGKLVSECVAPLNAAVEDMLAYPDKYLPMNPSNGWGSYESLVPRLEELLADLRRVAQKQPDAVIRVSG